MKCAFPNQIPETHLLRAELIFRQESGDLTARRLLARLVEYGGDSVSDLIQEYRKSAGPLFLERLLFCLGALCAGLAVGICGLTAADLVPAELESLVLSLGAFLLAQWSLALYGKLSKARFYAEGFSKVMNDLGRRR